MRYHHFILLLVFASCTGTQTDSTNQSKSDAAEPATDIADVGSEEQEGTSVLEGLGDVEYVVFLEEIVADSNPLPKDFKKKREADYDSDGFSGVDWEVLYYNGKPVRLLQYYRAGSNVEKTDKIYLRDGAYLASEHRYVKRDIYATPRPHTSPKKVG